MEVCDKKSLMTILWNFCGFPEKPELYGFTESTLLQSKFERKWKSNQTCQTFVAFLENLNFTTELKKQQKLFTVLKQNFRSAVVYTHAVIHFAPDIITLLILHCTMVFLTNFCPVFKIIFDDEKSHWILNEGGNCSLQKYKNLPFFYYFQ